MILRQLLYRTETRLLPVEAGYWMVLPPQTNYEEIIRLLCVKMLDGQTVRKVLSGPHGREMSAGLGRLAEYGGTVTAEDFEKEFGPMRVAGIEKVLREKYWKNPVSVTEALFYRGLIFRHDQFVSDEVKACYTIPEDMLKVLRPLVQTGHPSADAQTQTVIVRPAVPSETAAAEPADDCLPEIISIAAALKRSGDPLVIPGIDIGDEYADFIQMILSECGFFPGAGEADPEAIRSFMVSNRTAARLQLMKAWRGSAGYDELSEDRDHLKIPEAPHFDRTKPRNTLLQLLSQMETDTWWSLNGFISAVKNIEPSFLRGNFEKERWIIHDEEGNDLSGQSSWFQLEGSYIRFILFGPLRWLGILQTAYADLEKSRPSAFRLTREGSFYIRESAETEPSGEISAKPNLETTAPRISADGSAVCGKGTPRYFLYMAARYFETEKFNGSGFTFRLTPNSLLKAEKNGLTRESLLSMLRRFSGSAVPPSLERMLSDPKAAKLPATVYTATILTVPDAAVMDEIINNNRLVKWVIQPVNQNSLVIDPKGISEIRRFLMEKEIFVDIRS